MALASFGSRPRAVWFMSAGLLFVAAASGGCASTDVVRDAELRDGFLAWIKTGVTTRTDAVIQLGEPSSQIEGGRILTWRLDVRHEGEDERLVVMLPRDRTSVPHSFADLTSARFSLVAVFDGSARLERWSLVSVR